MLYHGSVALVVLALVGLAAAQPIKETVSNCSAMLAAFNKLSEQFAKATTPTPLSLTLTLNCSADWSSCGNNVMTFAPSGPAKSPKQPPVKITITAKCNKGKNVTINTITDAFINIDTANTSAKVDVRVENFKMKTSSRYSTDAVRFTAANNSKSTLKVKQLSTDQAYYGIFAIGLDSVSVSGGTHQDNAHRAIAVDNIAKRVSVTKVVVDGYYKSAMDLRVPGNAQVSLTGNTCKNAEDETDVCVLVTYVDAKVNVKVAKLTNNDTTVNPICILSEGRITPATVLVTGSLGISPTKMNRALKPAGWPATEDCNIASFAGA